ncbi:hypothetical protein [Yoonia sp.]|uniref:FliH/SctL family protein n=1 Tax=Yoonia sp. TaxID=2212373 RepID=UPI001A00AC56|nr:hypothetical protein [Yoonia sp.]MBE0413797.1 hypothetical protein [Yoonia sp.]
MSRLSLESFEAAAPQDPSRDIAFQAGYDEGFDAGLAEAKAQNTALAASLVQVISDVSFGYAEARAQILEALTPFFGTLTSAVLPHCVETGFAGVLAQELVKIAADDISGPIRLCVHPDQQAAVEVVTSTLPTDITVIADSTLDHHAAWISCANSESQLNLDRLLAQITDALTAINPHENRTNANG